MRSAIRKHGFLAGVVLLILVADQLSKRWVVSHVRLGESWNPLPLLQPLVSLTYVTNTGVAFGLFPAWGDLFVGVAILAVAGILAYYLRLFLGLWVVELSLGLVVAGAIGNLLDRLTYGHVVDFVDFKVWPVFNVADSAIVIGMAILVCYLWRHQDRSG